MFREPKLSKVVVEEKDIPAIDKNSPINISTDNLSPDSVYVVNNTIHISDEITHDSLKSVYKIYDELDAKLIKEERDLIRSGVNINYNSIPIIVDIDSYGGYLWAGFGIYDFLKRSVRPIHTWAGSGCLSAATIIFLAGKVRYISKNSTFLIHQLSGSITGTYGQMKDEIKAKDISMLKIKTIYLENSNLTEEEVDEYLKHETYLTAEQCVAKGLAHEIK